MIDAAADILRRGGLVAFPTETVYGLGADAANPAAVARMYAVKGRPSAHPVIVHMAGEDMLSQWARDVPEAAKKLARTMWPGPLTLILRRAPGVLDAVTGGLDTIGLRVPGHPLALRVLQVFGGGIAAPSANKFGRISPTTAEHVRRDLGDEVDLILDGGPCEVGIESTIVDLSRGAPFLLRPGKIRAEDIAGIIGVLPRSARSDSPRAPGTLEVHYAPRHPLRLVARDELEQLARSGRYAVLAFDDALHEVSAPLWLRAPSDAARYARELYASLRALDDAECDAILVERPPEGPDWTGARDRLSRAAASREKQRL